MKFASFFVAAVIGQELDLAEDMTEESALLALSSTFGIDVTSDLNVSSGLIRRRGLQDTRSYGKVKLLHRIYHSQQGKDFQTSKLKLYGCHCGGGTRSDFDYTASGIGVPVDGIDSVCRDYANCLKCVDEAYDGKCARDTRYRLGINKKGGDPEPVCKNDLGSCRRSVCECDKQFAKNMAEISHQFELRNWFRGGFNRERKCKKKARSPSEYDVKPLGCCGTKETFPLNRIYRSDQCCVEETAEIKAIGTC